MLIPTVAALVCGVAAVPASAAATTVTLQGTVRDASGHGWPLAAQVSVGAATTTTSPSTGHYALQVPANATATLEVVAAYPGYPDVTQDVPVGANGGTANVAMPVDAGSCIAPGYRYATHGSLQNFDTTDTPSGWTVVDNEGNGEVWRFDDPGKRGNLSGGQGGFAIIDSEEYGYVDRQDSSLVSPVVDLSALAAPSIGFDSDFTMFDYSEPSGIGDVDLSVDGGDTWQNVWHVDAPAPGPQSVTVPVPAAAHQAHVRIRFHYYESPTVTAGRWWQVDNVFIGDRSCAPVRGALMVGRVDDANTGEPVAGASVSGDGGVTTSADDGRYWRFAAGTGVKTFTATKRLYHDRPVRVRLSADRVVAEDFAMPAGQLTVSRTVHTSPALGRIGSGRLVLTNTGTADAKVTLAERPGGFRIADATGQPWGGLAGPPAQGWVSLPDYPTAIRDNVAGAYDGRIYSFGGVSNISQGAPVTDAYRYDPASRTWQNLAPMPTARQEGVGAFIGHKFYVVDGATGGFGQDVAPQLDIYDADTDTWSSGADIPIPMADSAATVLGGRLYVIGGCDTRMFCGTAGVLRYTPATDTWQRVADYPAPESWLGCGAIEAKIYCTGGQTQYGHVSTATYAYDPAADTWTPRADLPVAMNKMGYGVANGRLLVTGGVISGLSTNKGFAYDPVKDVWSALPDSINMLSRGATACGLYKIGGAQSWSNFSPFVEMLPGYDNCGSDRDVAWLNPGRTHLTLRPGQRVRITLATDAARVDQPGRYRAEILVRADTPYGQLASAIQMTAKPPAAWSKLMGTVTGLACGGTSAPARAADVWVAAAGRRYSVTTNADGRYALWLGASAKPAQVTIGGDEWVPRARKVTMHAGRATVLNADLAAIDC